MRTWGAVSLFVVVTTLAFSQEEPPQAPTWANAMALGLMPYRQLTADDFAANDAAQPKHNFYIRAAMLPRYRFITKPYQGFAFAHIDEWMVFSGWDKNQTVRKRAY